MDNLQEFLNPKRKENIKFKIKNFGDAEWEMRQLNSSETLAILDKYSNEGMTKRLIINVANALVKPDLRNVELIEALEARSGKKLTKPHEVLLELVKDFQDMTELFAQYNKFCEDDFKKK